ncbi:MAG: type II toxin-antitoxin system Phd/YefM family antitoxin [Deltaproteobacteria bacterium]|nr:type II toxin-antitoxin system Phd/YefM family antitoxin [Deltaproteobacteria bacterium]
MKFVSIRDAKAHLSEYLEKSQREGVVLTNHGKPQCVVIGIEGYDMEEVVMMTNPNFWKMIETRRKQPRTSLDNFERELAHRKKKEKI